MTPREEASVDQTVDQTVVRPLPVENSGQEDTSGPPRASFQESHGLCCTFTYPCLDWAVTKSKQMDAAVFNAQSTKDRKQWREELSPAPTTKSAQVADLDVKALPQQWKFQTQVQQAVPGVYWRHYERVPVSQARLTINKTVCCQKTKDSAQCWICSTAVCELCSTTDPLHNVLFQQLAKTSWCPECLAEAIQAKDGGAGLQSVRCRCCNPECSRILYSAGPLNSSQSACSQGCFDQWQRVEVLKPDKSIAVGLQFDTTPHVDQIETCGQVGVFMGSWKHTGIYLERIKTASTVAEPVDTSDMEAHISTRTVQGELLWPLRRPESHFDMLFQDLIPDVKKPEATSS